MARRIRNIKPEYFEDEKVAMLPMGARLLYIGLWTRADMGGVFEYNVKVVTAAIFPHDDDVTAETVVSWLKKMEELGFIKRFEISDKGTTKAYGHISQFTEHQAISKAERDKGRQYPRPVTRTVPGTVPETPDEGRMTRDEGRGTTGDAPTADPAAVAEMENIMAKDQVTAARIAAEPMIISWQDWRAQRRIGVGRTGEDGDTDAWRGLWNYHGDEIMTVMYDRLIPTIAANKKLWYSQAAEWLAANTEEKPNV